MHPLVDSSSAVCKILQDPDVAIFIPCDGKMTVAGCISAQTKAELSPLAMISWIELVMIYDGREITCMSTHKIHKLHSCTQAF